MLICLFLQNLNTFNMKKVLLLLLSAIIFSACTSKKHADFLVINAKVYTVNEQFDIVEAFAVKDGKILELGTSETFQNSYNAKEIYDLSGKTVYPGFIDGHAHFYGLGQSLQQVDLTGAASFDELLDRVVAFQQEKQKEVIRGRGWNQNLWPDKQFPTKDKLDSLFPDTPVVLNRIDGHAYLVNQKALDMAGITASTKLPGGEVVLKDGQPTGVLIDRPMDLINEVLPPMTRKEQIEALLEADKVCLSYGLTTINDAGLERDVIELIDSLQKAGALQMRIYAMVSADKPNDLEYYLNKGVVKTEKLHVRSVKVYGDGALGSRGAALKQPYSDHHGHFGAMVTSPEELEALAAKIVKTDYQMNTHAIGDSANYFVLKTYETFLQGQQDRRWKIEHAQILSKEDFTFFANENIIPSAQPTHATSDMYWASERLGDERIKDAYAYADLLQQSGLIVLGTDFPVEEVNPFYTFYAAVARKDLQQFPEDGFQKENALSREQTLKGMTIWAAYSNFEENEKGSLEPGKWADFIILDKDLMVVEENEIPQTKVEATFLGGEKVF
jgi:predicted amidohydrolase YtcJ